MTLSIEASHAATATNTGGSGPQPSPTGHQAASTGHTAGQRAPMTPDRKTFHLPTQANPGPVPTPAPPLTQSAVTTTSSPAILPKPGHDQSWIWILILIIAGVLLLGFVMRFPSTARRIASACLRAGWWLTKFVFAFVIQAPKVVLWALWELGGTVRREIPYPTPEEQARIVPFRRIRPPLLYSGRKARG